VGRPLHKVGLYGAASPEDPGRKNILCTVAIGSVAFAAYGMNSRHANSGQMS